MTVTCASATMDSNSMLASLKRQGNNPLFICHRTSELKLCRQFLIPQICPPVSSRATPGAVLGTPWEWKGYSQTTTDRTKYSEKQQQHKKTTRYSDKPSDRQTYASNGSGSNGASLLETVATFITPVTLQFFANYLFIKKELGLHLLTFTIKAGLVVSFSLQELICNLVAGQACGILTGQVWKTITL